MRKVLTFSTIAALLFLLCGPGVMRAFAMSGSNIPVDVMVDDQRITDARVLIKQIDSFGPAWLVVYASLDSGELGPIVGYAAVADGLTQYLVVALEMKKVTRYLVAGLCVDKGVVGVFEPTADDHIASFKNAEVKVGFTVDW